MRIGAIFARGSCRALKWMALFGVVFALGAGSAIAQITITGPADNEVTEGNTAIYTVNVKGYLATATDEDTPQAGGTIVVTLAAPTSDTSDTALAGELSDIHQNEGASVTFTVPANTSTTTAARFNQSMTLRVGTNPDPDAENEAFTLAFSATGDGNLDTTAAGGTDIELPTAGETGNPNALTIDDAQDQGYELALAPMSQKPTEGTPVTISLKADPPHEDGSASLTLNLNRPMPDWSFSTVDGADSPESNPVTIDATDDNDVLTITVMNPSNDKNRDPDDFTLTVHSGLAGSAELEDSLTVTLADANVLPEVTATIMLLDDEGDEVDPQPDPFDSIEEGQSFSLQLNVVDEDGDDPEAREDLTITLMATGSADALDYQVSAPLTVAMGAEASNKVTVTVRANEEVNPEMLVFDAVVNGDDDFDTADRSRTSMDVVSLAIVDRTEKQIQAKTQEDVYAVIMAATAMAGDDGVNPGETVVLPLDEMFTPTMGYDITYGFEMEGSGVAEAAIMGGTNLEVTAMGEGQAKFTVTATATPMASGVEIISQTRANVAQVLFPIDVVLKPLSIDVTADPMMIDEGMSTMVMANANRNVTEDTMVALEIVGALEGMAPEAIVIAADGDSGYVELTAAADDDTDGATLTVVAIHSAIEGGSKSLTIAVNDTTEPPAETTYTLTASADSVMEGGEVEINVEASQAVAENTEIMLVHGAGSASADDYSVEMLMIEAGSSTGGATLMAIDDSDVEGDETLTLNGMMGNVVVDSVMLTITDNDEAPVVEPTVRAKDDAAMMIADAISTAAGDADWMVGGMVATVDMSMLFDVDEGVTADYSGTSSDESVVSATTTGGTMLALTAMSAGMATITVTGADRAGGGTASVMHDATVALQTLVLTVMADPMALAEGGSAMITASANRAVTEATMLSLTVTGDTAAVSVPEMLTIAMGDDSGMVEVMAVEDDDTMDANVSVVVSGAGLGNPVTLDFSITDNDRTVNALTQAEVDAVFTVAIAMAGGADGWLPGGGAAEVDMSELFMIESGATVEYMAESSAPDMVMASASGSVLTLTPMETGDATISVTATDTSGDADDHAMVSSMVTVGVLPLEIMVSPTTAEVEEGGTVDITATANKMVDANVEVMLIRDAASNAGEDDFSLEPALITIMAGEATGMATLTATDDYDVEGNESLTLVARVKDHGDVGTVMVSIMDNDMETTYELSGPMDTNIVEGMSYELTATANQAVHMDTEVMLMRDRAASDASDDDYSVGSIMIMAGEMSGTTMLMVTEDNMPDAGDGTNMGESLVLIGSVDGMEIGSLEFTIWDAAVPALPVIAQLLLAAFLALGGYRRYLRRR